jgi:hypothetical protein
MRRIARVRSLAGWRLEVEFSDGGVRWFDLGPLLGLEAFRALQDPALFASVRNGGYFVEWSNGADLSADTLYLEGTSALSEGGVSSRP